MSKFCVSPLATGLPERCVRQVVGCVEVESSAPRRPGPVDRAVTSARYVPDRHAFGDARHCVGWCEVGVERDGTGVVLDGFAHEWTPAPNHMIAAKEVLVGTEAAGGLASRVLTVSIGDPTRAEPLTTDRTTSSCTSKMSANSRS